MDQSSALESQKTRTCNGSVGREPSVAHQVKRICNATIAFSSALHAAHNMVWWKDNTKTNAKFVVYVSDTNHHLWLD